MIMVTEKCVHLKVSFHPVQTASSSEELAENSTIDKVCIIFNTFPSSFVYNGEI